MGFPQTGWQPVEGNQHQGQRAILLGMREKEVKTRAAPGEVELVRRIRQRAAAIRSRDVRLGIGDDCAVLRVRAAEEIVVTTDLSLEGRHFRLDWHPPEAVGHRALARGLSDLAAMGARPVAAFLSLAVPKKLTETEPTSAPRGKKSWTDRFYDGLLALAGTHKTPLAGGDLAEFPQVVADIMLVGAVPRDRAFRRSGARPGDAIYVTGALGGSAEGLRRLAESRGEIPARGEAGFAAHLWPQPRILTGLALQKSRAVSAAMDLSDGISTDLAHLCTESGVAAKIDESAIPIAPGATLDDALHGGEDYELLFTARQGAKLPRRIANVPVTQIGRIVPARASRPQVRLLTASGSIALQPRGWQHFNTQS